MVIRVICAVIAITGYAILGYFKASAKKAEDDLIEEWREYYHKY